MKVLLSIKPEFVNEIRSGRKKYEFRRTIFKRANVEKIVIYETAPISRVIGEVDVKRILHDDLDEIWQITAERSGINKSFFDDYFINKERGFAIELGNLIEFSTPKKIQDYGLKAAPQSFVYI